MFEQQAPGFGRGHAAAVADQEVLPQFHLQQPDLTAQGRLGDVERDRCAGETAEFGDAYEVFELFEVHGARMAWEYVRRV